MKQPKKKTGIAITLSTEPKLFLQTFKMYRYRPPPPFRV